MENSKEKNKSNVVVIVLLSIAILLLLVVSTILLIQPSNNQAILVTGKDSNIEGHSSNKKPIENIPINNSLYLTDGSNENNANQTENNVNTNNTIPSTSGGENANTIPDTYGGEDVNTIPDTYGGSDIVKSTKNVKLNNVNHKVEVTCTCTIAEKNNSFTVYSTSYSLTVDGNICYGIPKFESILPDVPQAEDCFAITKISDKVTHKEYLVLQVFCNWSSGTNVTLFIINDNLEIFESIKHIAGTTFIIDGIAQELEIWSDYISDYTWNDEGVAHHIYSMQNGKFVDTIEKVYKDGEYEAAGRT